jgi:hypothetical protein
MGRFLQFQLSANISEGMELCSIEDAFPNIGKKETQVAVPGCTDTKPTKEERRALRKKAKRCKDAAPPAAAVPEPDPDRPSVKRMGEVPVLMKYDDAFPDLGTIVRDTPAFRTTALPESSEPSEKGTESFRMPRLPSSSCLISDPGLPGYFGKDIDDDEGFADYSAAPGDNPGYVLVPPTLDSSFEAAGAAKAGALSGTLPVPSLSDVWKPLTPAGARTAVYKDLPAPGGHVIERVEPELPIQEVKPLNEKPTGAALISMRGEDDKEHLLKRIKDLTKRLDDLEQQNRQNTKPDLLLFVGIGMAMLVSFDVVMRMSRD